MNLSTLNAIKTNALEMSHAVKYHYDTRIVSGVIRRKAVGFHYAVISVLIFKCWNNYTNKKAPHYEAPICNICLRILLFYCCSFSCLTYSEALFKSIYSHLAPISGAFLFIKSKKSSVISWWLWTFTNISWLLFKQWSTLNRLAYQANTSREHVWHVYSDKT